MHLFLCEHDHVALAVDEGAVVSPGPHRRLRRVVLHQLLRHVGLRRLEVLLKKCKKKKKNVIRANVIMTGRAQWVDGWVGG